MFPEHVIHEPTNDDIRTAVIRALTRMVADDTHLFHVGVSERSLTFRLGHYLQCEFPRWQVDCEYNRNGEVPKRLRRIREEMLAQNPDTKSKGGVFPDIILHRRGPDGPNLFVIEAKKASENTPEDERFDRLKLGAYQDELGYHLTAFVVFVDNDIPTFTIDFDGAVRDACCM